MDKLCEFKLFIRFLKEENEYKSEIIKGLDFNKLNNNDSIEWLYSIPIFDYCVPISLYRKYLIFVYKNNFRIVNEFVYRRYVMDAIIVHTIGYLHNAPKPKELLELEAIYDKLYN